MLASDLMFWRRYVFFILLCTPCFGAADGDCTERTVIVTARDNNGKTFLYPLQVADLRAKIDGKPMQILGAVKGTSPTRIALVLDASGSMAGKWQRALEFAIEIIRESPSSTEFALVLFADNEFRSVEFGQGAGIVDEILSFKSVKPSGRTRLRDGIGEAVTMFHANREGDAIVVVSDNGDNQSKVSMRQLREAMWSRGIRVMFAQFVDHYLSDQSADQFQDEDDADAAGLSQSSGGFLFRIEDPKMLPKTAQDIALEISNYLALRITLPRALEKDASVHLEAVDASGHKRKNIELGFPEKLLPCSSIASTQ